MHKFFRTNRRRSISAIFRFSGKLIYLFLGGNFNYFYYMVNIYQQTDLHVFYINKFYFWIWVADTQSAYFFTANATEYETFFLWQKN